MYKKHIEHLAIVSLKYFFDIDYVSCSHVFIVILVGLTLFKLSFSKIATVLQEGIISVKEDAVQIKGDIISLKALWGNGGIKEMFINNLRSLKNFRQKLS